MASVKMLTRFMDQVVLFLSALILANAGFVANPSEDFPYSVELNPDYQLYWRFNDTHIRFETHVRTLGYVALGISRSSKMYPADMVIGWVKGGKSYFKDRFTSSYALPSVDKSQDWTLLSASEQNSMTVLKFERALNTCDTKEDLAIEEGSTRVIFSYHPDDPEDEDTIPYHGTTRRGSKSLLLLDPPPIDSSTQPEFKDTMTFDMLNGNVKLGPVDTTYHCTTWRLPTAGVKHHIVKYEPIIEKGHEALVHHMLVYSCLRPVSDDYVGLNYTCYEDRPSALQNCFVVSLGWAVGGKEFLFPEHVGFPVGHTPTSTFFILETHYDNPAKIPDYVDNSGFRLTLTTKLRPNDAGTLMIGVGVNKKQVVPPLSPSFISRGYCTSECLGEALAGKEIKVFSNILHSHLAGVAIRTRIVRGDQEIAPLAQDNNYDFNYQEARLLKNEITLKSGDRLIVECTYDTRTRSGITVGGLSTRDEMCLSFPMYYPQIPLALCQSEMEYDLPDGTTTPEKYAKLLDWTQPINHEKFKNLTDDSDVSTICGGSIRFKNNYSVKKQSDLLPVPDKQYVAPAPCQPPY